MPNAAVPVEVYGQRNYRSLANYLKRLGCPDEATFVAGLRPGSVIVDGGGGYGFAMMELARKYDVRGVVINYGDTRRDMGGRLDGIEAGTRTIGDVEAQLVEALGLGHCLTDGTAAPQIAREARAALEALEATGRFSYRYQAVEGPLPPADRQLDVYGAFTYSDDPVRLMRHYHDSLKPNGEAWIHVPWDSDFKVAWRRHAPSTHLFAYLIGNPAVQVETTATGGTVFKIKNRPGVPFALNIERVSSEQLPDSDRFKVLYQAVQRPTPATLEWSSPGFSFGAPS